ncbi:MAG TPA: biotin/lipoyl-containing protein [Armatimonadota bacterium]|jgi:glycine cleavage system H protein
MEDHRYLELRHDKFVFRVRTDRRYSDQDTWVRLEDGEAVIGLSDFRQQAIGDLTFATPLPEGALVAEGGPLAELETMKTAFDVASPLAGTVLRANHALSTTPELINQDPYGEGWLVRLAPASPQAIESLLSPGSTWPPWL